MIDPPDRTFEEQATVEAGERELRLTYLGRGHTNTDIAIEVLDANVLFAGDLIEEGATPSFGDSYPLEWPGTVERLLPLATGAVVPGHGAIGDRAFVESQLAELRANAEVSRGSVHAGELDLDAAIEASPYSSRDRPGAAGARAPAAPRRAGLGRRIAGLDRAHRAPKLAPDRRGSVAPKSPPDRRASNRAHRAPKLSPGHQVNLRHRRRRFCHAARARTSWLEGGSAVMWSPGEQMTTIR